MLWWVQATNSDLRDARWKTIQPLLLPAKQPLGLDKLQQTTGRVLDGLFQVIEGRLRLAELNVHHGPPVVGFGEIWVEAKGLVVVADGSLLESKVLESKVLESKINADDSPVLAHPSPPNSSIS